MSPRGGLSTLEYANEAVVFVPIPTFDSILREPPQSSADCLRKGSPMPTLLVVLVVVKGSVTFATNSSVMPLPSSCTEKRTIDLQAYKIPALQ